jgi:hypothetical protein
LESFLFPLDLNRFSVIEMAFKPETLITDIAPNPYGVAKAIIVS